jgi:hypothetical protein
MQEKSMSGQAQEDYAIPKKMELGPDPQHEQKAEASSHDGDAKYHNTGGVLSLHSVLDAQEKMMERGCGEKEQVDSNKV